MFYIWTAIKFLKKALVSLVLMKSFVSPRQHIPCGEGCFPPISDIVNSHRDSQGTCYSCCILFFSKGTRNPTIQHIPLACTWSGGCQTKCQACKAGISPEQTVSAKNSTSSPKGGGKYRICPLHSCLASTCRLAVLSKSFAFHILKSQPFWLISLYNHHLPIPCSFCWLPNDFLNTQVYDLLAFFFCVLFPRVKDTICVPKIFFNCAGQNKRKHKPLRLCMHSSIWKCVVLLEVLTTF